MSQQGMRYINLGPLLSTVIGLGVVTVVHAADEPSQSSNQAINNPVTPVEAAELPSDATVTPERMVRSNGTTANSPSAFKAAADAPTARAEQDSATAATAAQVPTVTTSPDPTGTGTSEVTSITPPNQSATDTSTPSAASTIASTSASSSLSQPTESMAPSAQSAADALAKKSTDASSEKNLDQVFKAQERNYSLIKRGSYSANYDIDYSYYRNTVTDLSLDDTTGTIRWYRLQNDAQHSVGNTLTFQYGLLDNLTLSASLPFVAKADLGGVIDKKKTGIGDVSFGARWEPFPLKQGRLPLILSGSLSTKTGDSPYEIDPARDLATGKGYYSASVGASTRKFIDPIVLFGSVSAGYGFRADGLNQVRGNSNRILTAIEPGYNAGLSFGFAYSLNYDVSLTMSYSQSFSLGSKFYFKDTSSSAVRDGNENPVALSGDQSTAVFNIGLGVRVSPKTIVNGSVGFGLTQDSPNVILGLSMPLDFLGFGREVK